MILACRSVFAEIAGILEELKGFRLRNVRLNEFKQLFNTHVYGTLADRCLGFPVTASEFDCLSSFLPVDEKRICQRTHSHGRRSDFRG
jgi:hypothetical protein